MALSEATKDVVYVRKFLTGLSPEFVQGPSQLATDSQSARDVSYNPQHHNRVKHVRQKNDSTRVRTADLQHVRLT